MNHLSFSYNQRGIIPAARGIYAFYLDLSYLKRLTGKSGKVDTRSALQKCVRAHTMSNPPQMRLVLHKKTGKYHSSFDVGAKHTIGVNEGALRTKRSFGLLASALEHCTFLTSPIYIGITDEQTFRVRYAQHYNRYKSAVRKRNESPPPSDSDPLDFGGKFGDKLAQRQIEFRDLLFVCVPLSQQQINAIGHVEKLLHVIVNPVLSER